MARSTGTYFEGVLAPVGSGQGLNLFNEIQTRLESFQSNGGDAWENYDAIAGGANPDVVWRSLGDRAADGSTGAAAGVGDANLFFRMTLAGGTAFTLNAYQDWSTNGVGSGIRAATAVTTFSVSDTDSVEYFGVVNEYEFVFIYVQTGTWRIIWLGSPRRLHIPTRASGIARATGNVVAGGPVVIPLDRDLSTPNLIQVGQRVWVYDIVNTGSAFPGGHNNAEVATVTAIGTSSITVNTLANNHGSATSKAIVGLDPCPMMLATAASDSNVTLKSVSNPDATWTAVDAQDHVWNPTIPTSLGPFITGNDPAPTNLFVGLAASINLAAGAPFRGSPQHFHFWPVSTQANKDRMIPNFDSALAEKIFPALLFAGNNIAPAIGPGATP